MLNKTLFEQFSSTIQKILPPEASALKDDFKEMIRVELMATLQKMDLVTREEFDRQTGVLLKTRKKLEVLVAKVEQIEKDLSK